MTGKVVGSRWNVQVNMLGYTLDNTIYGETLEVSKPLLDQKKKQKKKVPYNPTKRRIWFAEPSSTETSIARHSAHRTIGSGACLPFILYLYLC